MAPAMGSTVDDAIVFDCIRFYSTYEKKVDPEMFRSPGVPFCVEMSETPYGYRDVLVQHGDKFRMVVEDGYVKALDPTAVVEYSFGERVVLVEYMGNECATPGLDGVGPRFLRGCGFGRNVYYDRKDHAFSYALSRLDESI
jgi:hypothetical protein